MPVARGQSRTETRADMQRTDSAVTFDNWMMRRFSGDGRSSDIVRLDRQLHWHLDLARNAYTECPLTGCGTGSGKPAQPEKPEQGAKPMEPSCPVTVRSNELRADPTGERRTVNGFQTERYVVSWKVEIEDGQGGRSGNLVQMDLWTTPETGAIRDVKAIESQFGRRYADTLLKSAGPLGEYLPKSVASAMSMLSSRIDTRDLRTLDQWGAQLRKVRGYPILTTMNWTTQGQVCRDGSGGAQAAAGGIGSMLGGLLGGRGQASSGSSAGGGGGAPLISFTQEVKSIAVKPVANAVFAPPAGFQRSN